MAVNGHTVDHGQQWSKGSLEAVLVATPVGKTSSRAGEKRDKAMGNLSKGGNRWLVGGIRPASEGNCHTRFLRPKPDAHRMYAQDQVVIHTVRM
jgi:hypothetical protein